MFPRLNPRDVIIVKHGFDKHGFETNIIVLLVIYRTNSIMQKVLNALLSLIFNLSHSSAHFFQPT